MEPRVELVGDGMKPATEPPGLLSTQTPQVYVRAKEGGPNFQENSSRDAAHASWPLSPTVMVVCQSTQRQCKFLLQSHTLPVAN